MTQLKKVRVSNNLNISESNDHPTSYAFTVCSTIYVTFALISQYFYRSVKEVTAILRIFRNFT